MIQYLADSGGFESLSSSTGLPDDMLIGFIISQLKFKMKNLETFHSHLENLRKLNNLHSQVLKLTHPHRLRREMRISNLISEFLDSRLESMLALY